MKFSINLSGKTLYSFMRGLGYAPDSGTAFRRPLAGRRYPRFHAYAEIAPNKKSALLNLHLDQKQPSYAGNRAHSGEYGGLLVETEVARIQSLALQ